MTDNTIPDNAADLDAPVTDLETPDLDTPAPEMEPPVIPIEVCYEGEAPSISGRSVLTYAFGRHQENGSLHFRLVANSGSGMFSNAWVKVADIEALIANQIELTSKSFQSIYKGKSINSGGFLMAVLKDLGVIRPCVGNTRLHEHVPDQHIEEIIEARLSEVTPAAQTKRRKQKGA